MRQEAATRLFAVALIVASAVLIWVATGFRTAASLGSSMLDSSFLPIVVLAFIIVGSAALAVRGLLSPSDSDAADPVFEDSAAFIRPLAVFLVLAASYFVWEKFGFVVMSVAMAVAIAAIMNTRSVRIYAFLVLFGPAVAYVFSQMLGIQI